MLKKLSLFFATLFIGITAFLIIPTSFSTTKIDFPKEEPIKLIPNEQNKGERCKAEIYYVTEKTRETHEKEGYEFTVNDYCANLQENLIKAIQNKNPVEVKRLISLGANPQGVDFSGFDTRHPLYIASFGET
nr:hypothetical protein [Pyrinomonadaceae bacterium]